MTKIEEIKKEYEELFKEFKNCKDEKQYSIMLNKIKVLKEMIDAHSRINRLSEEEIQFNKKYGKNKNTFSGFMNTPYDLQYNMESTFGKNVFIVGVNINSANAILDNIYEEYLKDNAVDYIKSKTHSEVRMKDGTAYKTILASDNARGNRGKYAYIQYGVPLDVIEMVISPCVNGQFEIIR